VVVYPLSDFVTFSRWPYDPGTVVWPRAFRTRPYRRTRTRTQTEVRNSDSDLRNRDFPTPWPKIISQWIVYFRRKHNILRRKNWNFGLTKIWTRDLRSRVRRSASYTINTSWEMLTSLQYKCVNTQTRWVRVRRIFKVRNFRTRSSEKSADSDSDVRKALVWPPGPVIIPEFFDTSPPQHALHIWNAQDLYFHIKLDIRPVFTENNYDRMPTTVHSTVPGGSARISASTQGDNHFSNANDKWSTGS
jgi:hypothetical protein